MYIMVNLCASTLLNAGMAAAWNHCLKGLEAIFATPYLSTSCPKAEFRKDLIKF